MSWANTPTSQEQFYAIKFLVIEDTFILYNVSVVCDGNEIANMQYSTGQSSKGIGVKFFNIQRQVALQVQLLFCTQPVYLMATNLDLTDFSNAIAGTNSTDISKTFYTDGDIPAGFYAIVIPNLPSASY